MQHGLLLLASSVRAAGCKYLLIECTSLTPSATDTLQPSRILRRHYAHRFVSTELNPSRYSTIRRMDTSLCPTCPLMLAGCRLACRLCSVDNLRSFGQGRAWLLPTKLQI